MKRTAIKTFSTTQLHINDLNVELARKNVKNINLRITRPDGLVKVSAPKRMPNELIHAFITSKYDWIKSHQSQLQICKDQTQVAYKTGEQHEYFGQQYELVLKETNAKPKVIINQQVLELHHHAHSTRDERNKTLETWCRIQLKHEIPRYINHYESKMNLQVNEFGVKKMKTRWGTCNPKAKRIWLNLELAKKPLHCLEYVVLHEMVHLIEAKHNQRFYSLVSQYMSEWKQAERKLNTIE